MLPGDGLMGVNAGAIFHLQFCQRHFQPPRLPIRVDDRNGRDQHLPISKPASGFHREVADDPRLIVEVELIYSPNVAVRRSDHHIFQIGSIC